MQNTTRQTYEKTHQTSSFMRARSNTAFDTRRRLVTLATCLPSKDELAFDHRRTSYVSWMKRYYFFIVVFLCVFFLLPLFLSSSLSLALPDRITISLEIILLSLYSFVDIEIIIVEIKLKQQKKNLEEKRTFFY